MKILRNIESGRNSYAPMEMENEILESQDIFDFPKWKMHTEVVFLMVYNVSSFWSNFESFFLLSQLTFLIKSIN